jgi:hypothetical protein
LLTFSGYAIETRRKPSTVVSSKVITVSVQTSMQARTAEPLKKIPIGHPA